jgi:hypothetical protein
MMPLCLATRKKIFNFFPFPPKNFLLELFLSFFFKEFFLHPTWHNFFPPMKMPSIFPLANET